MARPKKIIRPVAKNISINENLAKMMEDELYSEVEGRIPVGAQSALINKLLSRYFNAQKQFAKRTLNAPSLGDKVLAEALEILGGPDEPAE